MKVTIKKAFSILDGRLSTKMEDVYEMLNYIYSDSLMTHQIPTAMKGIELKNPKWFLEGKSIIQKIKDIEGTNDFETLMKVIDEEYPDIEIELGKINKQIDFFAGIV